MDPDISVVIPLYNKAHTVVQTLQSLLAQDYAAFEVIIVNDGSTDGGPQLIERTFRDSRIRIVDQEHQGPGAARNTGVADAQCELIAFLDADDLLLPGYLRAMKSASEDFPDAGMYCCAGVTMFPDGSQTIRKSRRYSSITEVNFFENPSFFGNSSSTVVRKSRLHLTNGFPTMIDYNEDLVFFFTLASQVKVVFCPELLTIYRQGVPGQITADHKRCWRAVVHRSNLLLQFWARLPDHQRNPLFEVSTLRDFRRSLLHFAATNDYDSINYLLAESDPSLIGKLTQAERAILPRSYLRPLSIIGLTMAEMAWRSKRYPKPRNARRARRILSSSRHVVTSPQTPTDVS